MTRLDASAHLYRCDVLWRDDRVIVVNKPSGLAVHRGWASDPVVAVSLVRRVVRGRVHPVHRLDRGTSGALMFALDSETASLLQLLFRDQDIDKRYLALVRGVPPDEGVIDHPVPRKPGGPRVDAVTRFRRLATVHGRYSLVEAAPRTGRLHQIRRHLKHLSHPLVGDTGYGDGRVNRDARALAFPHPHTGERVEVSAPPPDDLRVPLERMGFDPALWADPPG